MLNFRFLPPIRQAAHTVPTDKTRGLNWTLLITAVLLFLVLVTIMPLSTVEADDCECIPHETGWTPIPHIVGNPSNFKVVVDDKGAGAQVTWEDGATDGRGNTADCEITHYDVLLYKVKGDSFISQGTKRTTKPSFTLTGLPSGERYQIVVFARSTPCDHWNSESFTFTVPSTATPTAAPPTTTPTAVPPTTTPTVEPEWGLVIITPMPTQVPHEQVVQKKQSRAVRDLAIDGNADGTATVTWAQPRHDNGRCTPSAHYRYKVVLWTGAVGNKIDREEVTAHTTTRARTVEITGLTTGTQYAVLVWAYSDECENWSKFRRAIWTQP